VLSENKGKQTIRFEVADTGIGMSDIFIAKIFDKFSQEQDTANRKFEGTGLGMAISNDLIDLMGGTLTVRSEKGKGSTFSFDLEFSIGTKSNLVNSIEDIDKEPIIGSKILLVEDNEMNRFIAIQTLSGLECAITEAENGLIALEILKKETFDLILMDIQMPEMDGVEATKNIRGRMNLKTPIIALTANAFKHDIEMYLSVGMNSYITKPYDEKDFLSKVYSVMYLDKKNKQQEGVFVAEAKEGKLYDLSFVKTLSKGNEAFVSKMASLFVDLVATNTEILAKAFDESNNDLLRKTAHKIKPSIDQMGISSLKNEIRCLENHKDDMQKTELHVLVNTIVSQLLKVVEQLNEDKM
jgi:CheY-like chemotaxis protein